MCTDTLAAVSTDVKMRVLIEVEGTYGGTYVVDKNTRYFMASSEVSDIPCEHIIEKAVLTKRKISSKKRKRSASSGGITDPAPNGEYFVLSPSEETRLLNYVTPNSSAPLSTLESRTSSLVADPLNDSEMKEEGERVTPTLNHSPKISVNQRAVVEKCVVYSQWTAMLDLCEIAFEREKISFLRSPILLPLSLSLSLHVYNMHFFLVLTLFLFLSLSSNKHFRTCPSSPQIRWVNAEKGKERYLEAVSHRACGGIFHLWL